MLESDWMLLGGTVAFLLGVAAVARAVDVWKARRDFRELMRQMELHRTYSKHRRLP